MCPREKVYTPISVYSFWPWKDLRHGVVSTCSNLCSKRFVDKSLRHGVYPATVEPLSHSSLQIGKVCLQAFCNWVYWYILYFIPTPFSGKAPSRRRQMKHGNHLSVPMIPRLSFLQTAFLQSYALQELNNAQVQLESSLQALFSHIS